MFWERRRDVLHGPYVTREDVRPRKEAKKPVQPPQDALEELSRIVRHIDIDSNTEKAKGNEAIIPTNASRQTHGRE